MSVRETALAALNRSVADALPFATVRRNVAVPQAVGAGGLVILRDGDPGEPEVSLSPPLYAYEHRVECEAYVNDRGDAEAILAGLLADLGSALAADARLGGAVDHCEPGAPATERLADDGGDPLMAARFTILLVYVSPSPLG